MGQLQRHRITTSPREFLFLDVAEQKNGRDEALHIERENVVAGETGITLGVNQLPLGQRMSTPADHVVHAERPAWAAHLETFQMFRHLGQPMACLKWIFENDFLRKAFLEHPQFRATPTVIAAILITGILCTAVAFTVQSWAQQFTPATHTALIFTTEPVFAWVTSFIYLKERLGLRAGVGALLILGGVLLSELLHRL